jgi:hypothetical protein
MALPYCWTAPGREEMTNDKLTRIPNYDPQIPGINADSDWFELTRNRSVAGAEIERACSFAIH